MFRKLSGDPPDGGLIEWPGDIDASTSAPI